MKKIIIALGNYAQCRHIKENDLKAINTRNELRRNKFTLLAYITHADGLIFSGNSPSAGCSD